MHKAKITTRKPLQQRMINNGVNGDESFMALYYGSASSAGSVPFMWESQPGTPKHPLTQSSLPPLTPPPSYYSSSIKRSGSSRSGGFFRAIFLASSRKRNMSVSSCSSLSWQSTPVDVRREKLEVEDGGGSPTSTLCLGGEFKRSYRIKKMKKVMLSFVRSNGKA